MTTNFLLLIVVGVLMGAFLGAIAGFVWLLFRVGKLLDDYGEENGED